jgi:uncharacterized protein YbaA (DUF1428 family)
MYVDGFVMAVPMNKFDAYKKMARKAGRIWKEYGALDYVECIADDVQPGKLTSFPQAVQLKKNEVVFFSWITYRSRSHRDSVNKKVLADPRIEAMGPPNPMPFAPERMIWGGFKAVVRV